MTPASLARLLLLSAIWGSSFMLMRVAVPVVGPVTLIGARVLLAALFLTAFGLAMKKSFGGQKNYGRYLRLGILNSAIPFMLIGYAVKFLPAGLLSILNATTPIWGVLLGLVLTRTMVSRKTALGLALGVVGVALLVGLDQASLQPGAGLAIVAALGASFCYALSAHDARYNPVSDPFLLALGSMWAATLVISPAVPFYLPESWPPAHIIASIAMLGIVSSGVAYLLYFRLVSDIGPAPALTVTFLIPVFGVFFGVMFLDEAIGWHTIIGSAIIILGTALVTNFDPRILLRRKSTTS